MAEAPKPHVKPGAPLAPHAPVQTTPKPAVTAPRVPGAITPPRAPSYASAGEVTQVHPPAAEILASDAPESGWSDAPPAMPAASPPLAAPAPAVAHAAASVPTNPARAVSAHAVSAHAMTSADGATLRKIAREAVEEALASLRTTQRELDARLKNIELRLEQLAHRPPPLPVASPALAPAAPAFAPIVPAFPPAAAAPAPATAIPAAVAPAPAAAPAAVAVSMIPVSIAPSATPSMAPLGMDASTTELMRLASSPVGDDMLGGEFDGSRRGRRLKMAFGFFIFIVIAGAIASILVSQSMNSHG